MFSCKSLLEGRGEPKRMAVTLKRMAVPLKRMAVPLKRMAVPLKRMAVLLKRMAVLPKIMAVLERPVFHDAAPEQTHACRLHGVSVLTANKK